jgi:hypothetical protein
MDSMEKQDIVIVHVTCLVMLNVYVQVYIDFCERM